jgi:hypothetical protein
MKRLSSLRVTRAPIPSTPMVFSSRDALVRDYSAACDRPDIWSAADWIALTMLW